MRIASRCTAIFQNALQYMLIQRVDDVNDSVVLLPAWPCDWDVNFTVAAPRQTTITGRLQGGSITYSVTPTSRASTVRALPCQNVPLTPSPPPAPPPPSPSGLHCNKTAWTQICPPMPTAVGKCMACCQAHSAELFKMKCIGTFCWPDYCGGKPAPGCE